MAGDAWQRLAASQVYSLAWWIYKAAGRSVRRILFLPMLALLIQPAHAQWGGGSAESAAIAYCAARESGKSHEQAERSAVSMLATSMQGSFGTQLATVFSGGRQMGETVSYLIRRQCPQYFGMTGQAYDSRPTSGNGNSVHEMCVSAADYKGCTEVQLKLKKESEAVATPKPAIDSGNSTPWDQYLKANPSLMKWIEANPAASEKFKQEWLKKNSAKLEKKYPKNCAEMPSKAGYDACMQNLQ